MSLEQAASRLKAGTLQFEHVERYTLDRKKLFSELKTYYDNLKVSLTSQYLTSVYNIYSVKQ